VRVAGRAATASSLGKIRPLATVWAFYQETYVGIGVAAGYLPRDVMQGFSHLLADPGRQGEMRELVEDAPPEKESPYDSHPPIGRRIALVEAGEPGPSPDGPDRPAPELVRNAAAVFEAVFTESLNSKGRALTRLAWSEFMHSSVRGTITADARRMFAAVGSVTGGRADLAALFDALAAGRGAEIGRRLPGPDAPSSSPAADRETGRTRAREGLTAVTWLALSDAGKARWDVSWSELASMTLAEGFDVGLGALVEAAVAERPDPGPLRALLASAGVPDDFRV
jgi:hypothetical protein